MGDKTDFLRLGHMYLQRKGISVKWLSLRQFWVIVLLKYIDLQKK